MRLFLLTMVCMTLFAANSLFCRAALILYGMEPLPYTAIRALTAAMALFFLSWRHVPAAMRRRGIWLRMAWTRGSWPAALALFAYMTFFSFAYVGMPAAMGTLIFNATIQCVIIGWGLWQGSRLCAGQFVGFGIVMAGLAALTLPELPTTPPLGATLLGVGVGIAWGIYSILGRHVKDAVLATAGHFFRCVPLAAVAGMMALFTSPIIPEPLAVACAVCAGTLATACGYILWYVLVPCLSLVNGSVIQLSVPVITAILAATLLGEAITWHLVLCSVAILGGIAVVIVKGRGDHEKAH